VIPAGGYDITGKAQEQNRSKTETATLYCELKTGGETELDETFTDAPPYEEKTYGYGDAANMVRTGYKTSTSATVTLLCVGSNGATNVYVYNPTLSAIKVGALH
jgi:hypothetical protein